MAIIGLGPKGLFALERLFERAREAGPLTLLEVDLFEPNLVPGAGPVYDPSQPSFLRMNFSAEQINMWWNENPAAERLSFLDWRTQIEHDRSERSYPARAQVGRYLSDGFNKIRSQAPAWVKLTWRCSAVTALAPTDSFWRVNAEDGVSRDYDEVLLAVGHGTGDPPLIDEWAHAAPLIPAVFPVGRWLSPGHSAPGSAVAVRGFGLTFIDAAIALTEGRGGVFHPEGDGSRYRYKASADDPDSILPFSRTGRPMLAKPGPELAASFPELDPIAASARERILRLPPAFSLVDDLVPILGSAVTACLCATNSGRSSDADAWLLSACRGPVPVSSMDPAAELEQSLDVGAGRAAPDLGWALGHGWRSVYPALVVRLRANGMLGNDWPAFRRLAAEMERVSFGPPPENAAKLLALIAARQVDLTYVRGARLTTRGGATHLELGQDRRQVDAVINAVLPAPGIGMRDDDLATNLVAGGHARVLPGRRGLEVDADARCISRGGVPTPGLSALGRLTEDCVVGNDTLSRRLHPDSDRWARRVVGEARQGSPSVVQTVPGSVAA